MFQTCEIQGCDGARRTKGMCGKHYQRLKLHGSPYATNLNRYPIICNGVDIKKNPNLCAANNCEKPREIRNLCKSHYRRWQRGNLSSPKPLKQPLGETCNVPACDRKPRSKGLCKAHYDRFKKHGSALPHKPIGPANGDAITWLIEKVDFCVDDCIIWPFSRNDKGYGVVRYRDKIYIASSLMCELAHGPKPDDKDDAAHSCGNGHKGCVNPSHLSWKTRKENASDMTLHGTLAYGEKSPVAKLTETDVLDIRRRSLSETEFQKDIAREYGVKQSRVSMIKTGKTWRHLFTDT